MTDGMFVLPPFERCIFVTAHSNGVPYISHADRRLLNRSGFTPLQASAISASDTMPASVMLTMVGDDGLLALILPMPHCRAPLADWLRIRELRVAVGTPHELDALFAADPDPIYPTVALPLSPDVCAVLIKVVNDLDAAERAN